MTGNRGGGRPGFHKRCVICRTSWRDRDAFLEDPKLEFIGYQAFLEDGELGFFLFNHRPCGTTLTLRIDVLRDLVDEPVLAHEGRDNPSPYCLTAKSGKACPPECECAFVKRIVQTLSGSPPAEETTGE